MLVAASVATAVQRTVVRINSLSWHWRVFFSAGGERERERARRVYLKKYHFRPLPSFAEKQYKRNCCRLPLMCSRAHRISSVASASYHWLQVLLLFCCFCCCCCCYIQLIHRVHDIYSILFSSPLWLCIKSIKAFLWIGFLADCFHHSYSWMLWHRKVDAFNVIIVLCTRTQIDFHSFVDSTSILTNGSHWNWVWIRKRTKRESEHFANTRRKSGGSYSRKK